MLALLVTMVIALQLQGQYTYKEPHRPQIHFSPKEKWMNDPNGMVYHKGIYHLFYQYYPDGIVWGPMHWDMPPALTSYTGSTGLLPCTPTAWVIFFRVVQ